MAQKAAQETATPQRRKRFSVNSILDNVYFIFAGIAAVWLSWLILQEGFTWGWGQIWFYLIFWVVLAYLALPRLHRILTDIYVPNYFIGRARTSDGLLGDPVNLALFGSEEQLHQAMREAGWVRADDVTLASSWKIVASTLLRRSYDEAPVSPLFLFARKQDFAYQQEVSGNPSKRHHVRFWRCPDGWMLPGGHKADWLAAGTYDRAVGFSLFTLQITHKIEENTDLERDHIVETLTAADPAVGVQVIKDFSTGYHARNGGGDAIQTDGDLPFVDLTQVAVSRPADGEVDGADVSGTSVSGSTPRQQHPARLFPRPVQTTLGSALVFLNAAATLIYLLAVLLTWNSYQKKLLALPDVTPAELSTYSTLALWVIVILLFALILVDIALGMLVIRGVNWARIAVMAVNSASIITLALDFMQGEPRITLATNLVQLSLGILILLSLSSTAARDYARLPSSSKRTLAG